MQTWMKPGCVICAYEPAWKGCFSPLQEEIWKSLMNNYSDKALRSCKVRLWFKLTALVINTGSKKYQLMIHLTPALLWYCPNSGISCHAIVFYHINLFYQDKESKKHFQVKIIKRIYFTVANSDNFLFALKKIISVKPVITAHDSFRIETAYPALHYSIWTHGKRANSFSNRFLCLNANMANNHKKMLLLYLIFPWSF